MEHHIIETVRKILVFVTSCLSFLTRGDTRAYHELLEELGYANESLAHS